MNRTGYGQLCRVITDARRRAVKGHYDLQFNHLDSKLLSDCLAMGAYPDHERNRQHPLLRQPVWRARNRSSACKQKRDKR